MAGRNSEALWWSLFSAGGVVAAFFYPAMMLITGVAVPLGWIPADRLYELIQSLPVRLGLFVVISLPLFHFAHRFRHTAVELGLRLSERLLSAVSYGAAIIGTIAAAVVLMFR